MSAHARAAIPVLVLGTGSIGARHLKVLRSLDGFAPLALPKRRSRIAALRAEGFETVDSFEAARRRGARHCIVASDTASHPADALASLEAGLDVLVEKPLASGAAEAEAVRRRAARLRRRLCVGCLLRFSDGFREFRRLLPRIGKAHSIDIECRSYLPQWRPSRDYRRSYSARANEGGVLRDLIHEIDYAGWLFGWPALARGTLRNTGRLGIRAEECADLCWRTRSGALVSIRLDYLTRPDRRAMVAFGERGTLALDLRAQATTLSLAGREPRVFRWRQERDELLAQQARAFVSAGSDPRLADGEDGVRALAVCDAARRSSKSGREEAVHP